MDKIVDEAKKLILSRKEIARFAKDFEAEFGGNEYSNIYI